MTTIEVNLSHPHIKKASKVSGLQGADLIQKMLEISSNHMVMQGATLPLSSIPTCLQESERDYREGRYKRFSNTKDMMAWLERKR